jgi:hypothetical protein
MPELFEESSVFVERDTGEILLWDEEIKHLSYVNASRRQFRACAAAFEEATATSTLAEAEELAARLAVDLATIDPTALQDETGFWQSLLNDVLIGIYAIDDGE